MTSIYSSNRNPISHLHPYKQILRSSSDLHRFSLRRSHPSSLEFRLEETDILNKSSFRKLMIFLSKRTLKLKNPPAKEISNSGSLTKHLRGLQIRPGDAAQHITQVTRKFAKLTHFVIHDEHDSFVPIRIRKKVHPMRSLRSFVYDHEFCRDFLRCARYVTDLKIRKTSLELAHLKRLQRLENLHLILKTKYLSLPEEDVKFTQDLGETLQKLPFLKIVTLEKEIDPEIQPYNFMELSTILKGKAKTNLIADFLDVSNQRNKNLSVEKIMQRIHEFGIENLKVKYAGVVKVMKRFDRLFQAPVHMREDIYTRFLRTLMDIPFKSVQFLPSIHSYHIDSDLKDTLLKFVNPNPMLKIPGLSLTYDLDMIEFQNLDLLLDLYDQKMPFYEIALVSTGYVIRALAQKLEEHYSSVFSKIEQTQTELSLQIVAKNLAGLESLIQIIAPKVCSHLLKSFNIHLIDPIGKDSFESVIHLLRNSRLLRFTKQVGIDLAQSEFASADEIFIFLSSFTQAFPKVSRVMLSYRNTNECERALKRAFEGLRHQYYWVDFDYEINNERDSYE